MKKPTYICHKWGKHCWCFVFWWNPKHNPSFAINRWEKNWVVSFGRNPCLEYRSDSGWNWWWV